MAKTSKTEFIITGALIAAAYAGLTYLSRIFCLYYGLLELRVSEMLTILPVFTSAAIPGLTVGCFIANIGSFNLLDMIFGTSATLIAALLTYFLRGIKLKGLPLLAALPPVLVNAIVIGAEINWFCLPEGASLWGFIISGCQVGVSQLVVCYLLGMPFYLFVKKYKIFERAKKS